ncbi:MAG: TonB-dependent receptor [Erythrobacter sp.]|jgi:outer membrane receptor protein involved in Fe transport
MSTQSRLVGALIATTALVAPSIALAQDADPAAGGPETATAAQDSAPDQQAETEAEQPEISLPGGAIIVTGRRRADPVRSSAQVVSVLSSADIARTGEGNIAGSLSRVTGLSVVGAGYVYVRGLGDRYSLALLNGSPLPSPEPLRRVVPLDLFPTGVIASSLVQKSYSANFPGEFGGGVINLTTKATPDDPFLSVGVSVSGDSYTTFNSGITYYGSSTDWLGFDSGARDPSPELQAYFDSGQLIGSDPVDSTAIAATLITGNNSLIQQQSSIPANFSASLSAGKTFALGEADLGVIFAAGYSNKYLTRDTRQQTSSSFDLTAIESDFERRTTDQRVVINSLFGLGLEFGNNRIRWTNVYIHDALKQARFSAGTRPAQNATNSYLQTSAGFFERQLFDTQLVGEFALGADFSLDLRGGYANSQRKAPSQTDFEYVRTNSPSDPFGQLFVNRLNGNSGTALITFQDLDEDLWSGGADLTWRGLDPLAITIGGAYTDQSRTSTRRQLLFRAPSEFLGNPDLISAIGTLRPDYLLSPGVVTDVGITLVENDPGVPAFAASLETKAGYVKAVWEIVDTLSLDVGVRYEDATQTVTPIAVFNNFLGTGSTNLSNDYWLPAATLTWEILPELQFRLSGSKTIARPQFRELINQPYYDPDSNRSYLGNPLLTDSELYNGEARLEYYLSNEERVSVAGFYKRIDNPIESFVFGLDLTTSYANAPEADLYGAEFEVQKYFGLYDWGGFFDSRRFVVIGNYTYTNSKIKVGPGDTTAVFGAASSIASDYFRDGAPLTGQSDHLANVQLGLEDEDRLSQQTILISYASTRAVSRGLNGTPPQPDVIEKPGLEVDFVAREGFKLFGREFEVKAEVRNIFGTDHEEFQRFGDNFIDVNTYTRGTSFSLGVTATF